MEEARKEIDFLRTGLSSTQGLNAQLQQLLEEDSESHPLWHRQESVHETVLKY